MKSSIKSLSIATLLAATLTACGGGSSSGEPVATDDPVIPVQPNTPQDPQNPQVPQDDPQLDPQDPPQDPPQDDPQDLPLPLEGQTGWTFIGLDTREPLEFLKTLMCGQRAAFEAAETVAMSNDECDAAYPDLVSGTEPELAIYELVGTDPNVVKREGCSYSPDMQTLVCAWSFVKEDVRSSTGYYRYSLGLPFMPASTPELAACPADKPHHVSPGGFARAGAQVGTRVTKAPPSLPLGCADWADFAYYLAVNEAGFEREEYQPE